MLSITISSLVRRRAEISGFQVLYLCSLSWVTEEILASDMAEEIVVEREDWEGINEMRPEVLG